MAHVGKGENAQDFAGPGDDLRRPSSVAGIDGFAVARCIAGVGQARTCAHAEVHPFRGFGRDTAEAAATQLFHETADRVENLAQRLAARDHLEHLHFAGEQGLRLLQLLDVVLDRAIAHDVAMRVPGGDHPCAHMPIRSVGSTHAVLAVEDLTQRQQPGKPCVGLWHVVRMDGAGRVPLLQLFQRHPVKVEDRAVDELELQIGRHAHDLGRQRIQEAAQASVGQRVVRIGCALVRLDSKPTPARFAVQLLGRRR